MKILRRVRELEWPLLVLFSTFTYAPFLNIRMVRTGGDDKAYVAQAVAMVRDGRWFLQTLHDKPDYFKGPLHLILLHIGTLLFGAQMIATVYMNFLFVLAGALAVWAIARRRYPRESRWPLWMGGAFAMSIGIFTWAFASQMEVEVASFYAIAMYFLDRTSDGKVGSRAELGFWLTAGLVGWVKSPLHSVLIGLSGVLFWAWTGSLLKRLKSPRSWGIVAAGVALCSAGYAPAFILDHDNFVRCQIYREALNLPYHGTWDEAIVSLLTFFLIPWFFMAVISYGDALGRLVGLRVKRPIEMNTAHLLKLGFSISLPTIVYFCIHRYHGQYYNLSIVGAWLMMIGALWASSPKLFRIPYRIAYGLTLASFLLLPILVTAFAVHFAPMPSWWPAWLVPVAWVVSLGTLAPAIVGAFKRRFDPFHSIIAAAGCFFCLGLFLAAMGEREMKDIRTFIHQYEAGGKRAEFAFRDLLPNTWSEWGYLNYMIHRPVTEAQTPERLDTALKKRELILVSDETTLADAIAHAKKLGIKVKVNEWTRWTVVHWKNDEGVPYWLVAIRKHDLRQIERKAFILEPM